MLKQAKKNSARYSFTPAGKFRKDIAGLRAIAIVAVVIFHMFPAMLPGGFIGVDIFFVLSGFLIGGLLWREFSLKGSIELKAFYARRFRRLLPASITMITVVTIISLLLYPYWNWDSLLKEAIAATLYASNILFAYRSADYFTESLELPSPLLHTWTLGLEEQFYFILPLIIILLTLAFKNKSKFATIAGLALLTVVSFILSIVLTPLYPSSSFFLIHTRFWEFSMGVIAAIITYSKTKDTYLTINKNSNLISLLALSVIISSIIFFDPKIFASSYLIIFPVLATLAILITNPTIVTKKIIISNKAFVWVGAISYSWYLWHYAPITFLTSFGGDMGLSETNSILIAGAIGILLAVLSYYLVENPFRFKIKQNASSRKILATSIIVTASVYFLLMITLFANSSYKTAISEERLLEIESNTNSTIESNTLKEGIGFDPNSSPFEPNVLGEGLEAEASPTPIQELESLKGLTVLIVGDSHSRHWEVAVKKAVTNLGGKLVANSLPSCAAIDVYVTMLDGSAMRAGCKEHRLKSLEIAESVDIVILSQAEHYTSRIRSPGGARVEEFERNLLWEDAYVRWINEINAKEKVIGVFADNPKIPKINPAECVIYRGPIEECNASVKSVEKEMGAIPSLSKKVRLIMLPKPDIQVFDVYSLICDSEICKTYDEYGAPIFSDNQHLTEKWTLRQVPLLEKYFLQLANLTVK